MLVYTATQLFLAGLRSDAGRLISASSRLKNNDYDAVVALNEKTYTTLIQERILNSSSKLSMVAVLHAKKPTHSLQNQIPSYTATHTTIWIEKTKTKSNWT
jgi:hypothetical protein